jgi:tripartite-type tricarboxylate transporter receptor subunit TctC
MSNKLIYSVVKSISVLAAMTVASVGFTQDKYPSKPITFIMAVEAGADGDVLGRPLMDRVARILGQPITVINSLEQVAQLATEKFIKQNRMAIHLAGPRQQ